MHPLPILVALGATSASAFMATGQRQAFMALKGIMERQTQVCVPVTPPVTCERSCGPGNIPCISFPTCYNPSAGETCCSDGGFCPAGLYCTDAGCCPNGTPLSECGATVSLSVIPPPVESPTSPPQNTPPANTSPTSPPPTTSADTTEPPPPTITYTSSSTTTTSKGPVVTAGAPRLGSHIFAGLGGLGAALMAL